MDIEEVGGIRFHINFSQPLYEQILDQIRSAIAKGSFENVVIKLISDPPFSGDFSSRRFPTVPCIDRFMLHQFPECIRRHLLLTSVCKTF